MVSRWGGPPGGRRVRVKTSRAADSDNWRNHVWVLPAALAAAAIGLLCWDAWRYGYNPQWLAHGHAWWRAALQPDQNWTLLVTMTLGLACLGGFWLPRRRQRLPIGLIVVVVMVGVAAVLGTAAYVPCRGRMSATGVMFWILQLYVGQPPNIYQNVYPGTAACFGPPPLGLQLGQLDGLGATLIGAIAVASVLWRMPFEQLRSRFASDATVFTGLDPMTFPLLKQLTKGTRRPRNIIIIEPDGANPLLEEAKLTGARVVIGDPTSSRLLKPIICGVRGCALSRLYALGAKVQDNEAVVMAAGQILRRYQPDPNRQPHLVALVEDPRHADAWRGSHGGASAIWFEDALSAAESTACDLVGRVLATSARELLLCGDSSLALAILSELARRSWEHAELGRAETAHGGQPPGLPPRSAPLPVRRVQLLDPRSDDLLREYVACVPRAIREAGPDVVPRAAEWQSRLLRTLDAIGPAAARQTAVIIVDDDRRENGSHEAGRVGRLHPETPVFVLASPGDGIIRPIFGQLHPFERGLLVNGELPDDSWTRVARHWHECYRRSYPVPPGDPRTATRLPWAELDAFTRDDNILLLRSILTQVAALGREWVPVRHVPVGSFIELSDRDLDDVAAAEHNRWYRRRVAAGWSAVIGDKGAAGPTNKLAVPWAELPADERAKRGEDVKTQIAQLEDVGFLPIVPAGGPPEAASFERIGLVQATQLNEPLAWATHAGEQMQGESGDWRVIDSAEQPRTVSDSDFRSSHEPLGSGRWRRVGTFRAWQVRETVVIRTKEGRATARPGDWVVEAPGRERWPVTDDQFQLSYRPRPDLTDTPGQASTQAAMSSSTAPTISS
jgi:hypothetical protein